MPPLPLGRLQAAFFSTRAFQPQLHMKTTAARAEASPRLKRDLRDPLEKRRSSSTVREPRNDRSVLVLMGRLIALLKSELAKTMGLST